jgi:hypothetical protein
MLVVVVSTIVWWIMTRIKFVMFIIGAIFGGPMVGCITDMEPINTEG